MTLAWPESVLSESGYAQLAARVGASVAERLEAMGIAASEREALLRAVLPLAAWVHREQQQSARQRLVVGVSGAQGSGKSTLCGLVAAVLEEDFGLRVVTLSLDDFYLTHAEREALGAKVHPLLVTRGVPGTHDVALAEQVLEALSNATDESVTALPSFDKARDDRRPEAEWPVFRGGADVVLFEGWCLGALPQSELGLEWPVNELEANEDVDARWRRYVNAQLEGAYAKLFARLERKVLLVVPGMAQVFAWRAEQERKLAGRAGGGRPEVGGSAGTHGKLRIQSEAQLRRFIQHFERLTLDMKARLPASADVVLYLDEAHRFVRVEVDRPRASR